MQNNIKAKPKQLKLSKTAVLAGGSVAAGWCHGAADENQWGPGVVPGKVPWSWAHQGGASTVRPQCQAAH
jgi:hypothetical protein